MSDELLIAKVDAAVVEMRAVSARLETAIVKMDAIADDRASKNEFDKLRVEILKQAMQLIPTLLPMIVKPAPISCDKDHILQLLNNFLIATPEQLEAVFGDVSGAVLTKEQGTLLGKIARAECSSRELYQLVDRTSALAITDIQMERLSKIFSQDQMRLFVLALDASKPEHFVEFSKES